MKKTHNKWFLFIIIGFTALAALIFILFGQNMLIGIEDNLDLYIPQYRMLKNSSNFFTHDRIIGFLFGCDREYLPSELSLYTLLYVICPTFSAYVLGYFIKIFVAVAGTVLLARSVFEERFFEYEAIVYLCGFAYGILNLIPNFGIAFSSIPLLLLILDRISKRPHVKWYIALFFFPLLSSLSAIGIFIVLYLLIWFIYRWIRTKKFPGNILLSSAVLMAGYVLCEYRYINLLFLYYDEPIRAAYRTSYSAKDIILSMVKVFLFGDMHTESMHIFPVMPAVIIFLLVQSAIRVRKHEAKEIFKDRLVGILLLIIINSVVYALNYPEPIIVFSDEVIPVLDFLNFERILFFNPFLWYLSFFIVLKRMYELFPNRKWLVNCLAVVAILVIFLYPSRYNDISVTLLNSFAGLTGTQTDAQADKLTYREFYSEELFEKAKEDIGYMGEKAVAYGFYPSILEYNDISTLDGYLENYPSDYKKIFRGVILPALNRVPEAMQIFDNCGAKCYIPSGNYGYITSAEKNYPYTEDELYMNVNEFKFLSGRYIFSRVELTNAKKMGFDFVNRYTDDDSPYVLYVYRTTSRYVDKDRSDIPYEERLSLETDTDILDSYIEEAYSMVETETQNAKNSADPDNYEVPKETAFQMIDLLEKILSEEDKLQSIYTMAQIASDVDVTKTDLQEEKEEIYSVILDYFDEVAQVIREIVNSPFKKALIDRYSEFRVEAYEDYEDMTDEEKEREMKLQSLQNEYTQICTEEFYYEYDGQQWSMENYFEAPQDAQREILVGIMNEFSLAAGDILKQIVDIENEIAEEEGYDNYMEYAYDAVYNRDYSVDEAKDFFKEVRKKCSKYAALIERHYGELAKLDPGAVYNDDTKTFNMLLPYVSDFDPEMGEVMQYILDNHLYDLKPSETKVDRGYTASMDYYGDAYIMDNPYLRAIDLLTYIHEFGHYNYLYYSDSEMGLNVTNLDVDEIHSQAFELLMGQYYEDMIGEDAGKYMLASSINNLVNSVCDACATEEFEIYVYEHPDESVEEWNRAYKDILSSYGYDFRGIDGYGAWAYTTHLFYSPAYYIAYATSAIEALNLYVLSLDDYDAARNKYLQVMAMNEIWPFRFTMQSVGLPDIFESGEPTRIFRSVYKQMRELT